MDPVLLARESLAGDELFDDGVLNVAREPRGAAELARARREEGRRLARELESLAAERRVERGRVADGARRAARCQPVSYVEKSEAEFRDEITAEEQKRAKARAEARKRSAEEAAEGWRAEGHKWVGKRVLRYFDGDKPSAGVIVRWLPADGDDEALWHMVHEDGDEEDLDEKEVKEALRNEAEARAPKAKPPKAKKPRAVAYDDDSDDDEGMGFSRMPSAAPVATWPYE